MLQRLVEKLCEELSAKKSRKIRMNNELWVDCRRGLRSRWNLNRIPSGSFAVVREMGESVAGNAESQ